MELWQFAFIRDWPEIRKSEIPSSEFCPISKDWGELEITNLARMSLLKCYWMLQNARVTAFIISELLRENQEGVKPIWAHLNHVALFELIWVHFWLMWAQLSAIHDHFLICINIPFFGEFSILVHKHNKYILEIKERLLNKWDINAFNINISSNKLFLFG